MKKFTLFFLLVFSMSMYVKDKVKRPDTYNYNRGLEELSQGRYAEAEIYADLSMYNEGIAGWSKYLALYPEYG